MINTNLSFAGHARINIKETPPEQQTNLYDAINLPINLNGIKENLPDDVEIRFSTKEGTQECGTLIRDVTKYIAEFFKGEEKIGDFKIGYGCEEDQDHINKYVTSAITKCEEQLKSYEEKLQEKSEQVRKNKVLEQLKSKDGLVV